jgi:hypothetical protein
MSVPQDVGAADVPALEGPIVAPRRGAGWSMRTDTWTTSAVPLLSPVSCLLSPAPGAS